MTKLIGLHRLHLAAAAAALLLLVSACGGGDDVGDVAAPETAEVDTEEAEVDGPATEEAAADEPEAEEGGDEPTEAPDAAGGDCPDPGDEAHELTVAAASLGIPFLQLFVAEQEGHYADNNLTVEILEVQGSANATAAVESGQADLMVALPEGVIQARSQGSTMTMIGATVNGNLYRLYVQPEIESLDDLAGENIAMLVEGNGTHIQVQWLMDTHGPGQDQATYVAAGGLTDRLAALQAGQVAASLLFPPFDVQAERAGLEPLVVMADFVDGYPNEVFAGTEATLAEKAGAMCAFMAAMVESSQWLVDNPDEAVALAVEQLQGEEEVMREAYEFTAPFYALDGAVPEEGLQWTLDVMEEYAGLADPPAIEDLYDPSFLPST